MSLDPEALNAAGASLPDEHLQSAPAGSASTATSAPAAPAATPPANSPAPAAQSADPAAADPAQAGDKPPQNPDAQPQDPAPKKKGGVQTRIDELTRERYEAQREAEYWRQQAAAKAQPAEPEKPAPRIEDFQDVNTFLEARDKWVADKVKADIRSEGEQARQRESVEAQQHQVAIAQQQTVERFVASEQDAATRYPDYLESVQTPLMQQFKQARPDVVRAVIDSPHGPDIVYFLAKNPAAAQQIASLNPIAAAREVGRIEQMFMAPKGNTPTQAPPPPRSVGSNAQAERKPEDMSVPEYRKWRQSQGK